MKFSTKLSLTALMLAVAVPVLSNDGMKVSLEYAGYGYDTSVELIEDGYPVNLSLAKGKGTFGDSDIAITVEFVPDDDPDGHCEEGYVSFAIVPDNYWAVTITAADQSQVYGLFNQGWMCLSPVYYDYVGQATGEYINGSGRFEGVTGTWVSNFEGLNLDASIGFRSIRGDLEGTLFKH